MLLSSHLVGYCAAERREGVPLPLTRPRLTLHAEQTQFAKGSRAGEHPARAAPVLLPERTLGYERAAFNIGNM